MSSPHPIGRESLSTDAEQAASGRTGALKATRRVTRRGDRISSPSSQPFGLNSVDTLRICAEHGNSFVCRQVSEGGANRGYDLLGRREKQINRNVGSDHSAVGAKLFERGPQQRQNG